MFNFFGPKPEYNNRNVESVTDGILEAISEFKPVSGDGDLNQALIKLTRLFEHDKAFADSVSSIAAKVLELFPNEVEPEAEDDDDCDKPEPNVLVLTLAEVADIQNSATIEEAVAKLNAIVNGEDAAKADSQEEEKAPEGEPATTATASTQEATAVNATASVGEPVTSGVAPSAVENVVAAAPVNASPVMELPTTEPQPQ